MQNNYTLKLIKSLSYNPWHNLALEEHFLSNVKRDEVILYLWQNDNTVVIGRNQNPWRECRYNELEDDGGKLARRLSGGGAVYHDLGNLNFTFIAKENLFDIEKQLKVIIEAVKHLGINAEFSGRNDIIAEGRKFSGNAFYYDGDNCYHHGTLLVSSEMTKLAKYLQVSKEKIKSKGIESVEARVTNLSNINSDIDIDNLSEALEKSFQQVYNSTISETIIIDGDISKFESLYKKYSSWEWRYGETPNFEINLYNRFSWGDLDINFNLRDGHISEIAVFSDAMDSKLIKDIEEALKGIKLAKEEIVNRLDDLKISYGNNIIENIKDWVNKRDI
ncbi:lipoate--protein ligase [Clostridium bovifaecis]|uniref:lipoate--protein ligase n=1 Tax=Clostridium bovifaecis TaxID=2184719 RepID=A0A6I6F1M0_9CLOT|nr:lipoate--protein ligase [Clostridium bovifaecis]